MPQRRAVLKSLIANWYGCRSPSFHLWHWLQVLGVEGDAGCWALPHKLLWGGVVASTHLWRELRSLRVWEKAGCYKPRFCFALVRILLHSSQDRVLGLVALPLEPKKLIPGKAQSVEDLRRNSPCAWELLEGRFQKISPPFSCLGKAHQHGCFLDSACKCLMVRALIQRLRSCGLMLSQIGGAQSPLRVH